MWVELPMYSEVSLASAFFRSPQSRLERGHAGHPKGLKRNPKESIPRPNQSNTHTQFIVDDNENEKRTTPRQILSTTTRLITSYYP